jgi:hypothetical protein
MGSLGIEPPLGHNHPSGDSTPSAEDLEVTRCLSEAGRILGIVLLDHVVWTRDGGLHSIRELRSEMFAAAPERAALSGRALPR